MPRFLRAIGCRIRGNDFDCKNFLYFLRSKLELESRGTGVGCKTPPAEVRIRSDPSGILQESFVRTPTGAELRLQLQLQVNFVRTPTGAGLRLQLQLQVNFVWTPTGAGLRLQL